MTNKFIEKLNLNKYQWWRNHRRVVTLAFLILFFTSYSRTPHTRLFNVKDICGKLQMGQIEKENALKKLKLQPIVALVDYCKYFR